MKVVKLPPTQPMADGGHWEKMSDDTWKYQTELLPHYSISIFKENITEQWVFVITYNRKIKYHVDGGYKEVKLDCIHGSITNNDKFKTKEKAMATAEQIINQLT